MTASFAAASIFCRQQLCTVMYFEGFVRNQPVSHSFSMAASAWEEETVAIDQVFHTEN